MDKFFSIVGALVALTVVCLIVVWWVKRRSEFFTPLSDGQAVRRLIRQYGWKEARRIVRQWRRLADSLGYTGPVAWRVRAGFTFKEHAPKLGPCYYALEDPQELEFEDEPTQDAIVFCILRLVKDSAQKSVKSQKTVLVDLRQQFNLPQHHLSSYGKAALVAGLILTRYKRTGEIVPLDGFWVRTDTMHREKWCVSLGRFEEEDWLDYLPIWDEASNSWTGCFPLGVELIK